MYIRCGGSASSGDTMFLSEFGNQNYYTIDLTFEMTPGRCPLSTLSSHGAPPSNIKSMCVLNFTARL